MVIQDDIKDAIGDGRDELVRVLATHGVLPTIVESGGSSLGGLSSSPTFRLETSDGTSVADRQTRSKVVDALGMSSADDCETVREEIQRHDAWED
ncbi:hypothetical protein D3D02_05630 [Halobellus sp. Atlit-38R]|jgi:hypothetical protein|uniref:hypothetical protein n=1 Tax=Halobellus sp. Atlit-38R TaxID=2282131 RepID=UPI000EF18C5F|nr:hypothetical protein [Halobellus sp. Atlit-38R]RLM90247.1 hypothetical protein D3D02_05630 [Halobellus sp. Atlit-38R]